MKNSKIDIVKSWYPQDFLSNEEALVIYERLLKLFLLLYHEATLCSQDNKDTDLA